jgi:hypothetical protein
VCEVRARRSTWRSLLAAALLPLALTAGGCGGDDDEESGPTGRIDPADFSAEVTNPFFPLSAVRLTVFEGSETHPGSGKTIETRAENRLLNEREVVAGVRVAVVEVKEYENAELVERTLDYYAQRRDGSVMYFGELVDDYKDGQIVGHGGQWLAGKGNARPGLFMPARPKVGQVFEQERAPGVAEDRSTVVAVGRKVTTPAGAFDDCISTRDYAPLDKQTEFKFYCRDIGLVREQAPGVRFDLVRYR